MVRARSLLLAALVLGAGLSAVAPLAPEASAQAAKPGQNCSAPYFVSHANWEFCWQLDNLRVQGIEVNDAKYQGKRVLWKAGVPFSITRYHLNNFGPYKDAFGNAGAASVPGYGRGSLAIDPAHCPRWLGEGTLHQNGHVCVETIGGVNPRVAVWTRFDVYNYRFANGWIFHSDGTIEPKVMLGGNLIDLGGFGCSSQTGAAGCVSHFHHVYWRFDFDIDGEGGDSVQDFHRTEAQLLQNNPLTDPVASITKGGPWATLQTEAMLVRDPATFNKWRVADFASKNERGHARSYEVIPTGAGPGDGVASGDFWAFAYKGDSREIGYQVPTNPYTDAQVAAYANGEDINGADVVVWYGEHTFHEPRDEESPNMMWHTTGPVLRPRNFLGANNVESTYP